MKLEIRFLLIFIISIFLTTLARAQSPITAKVDRTSLSTDEFVNLTVVVSSSSLNAPRPSLPPLNGFEIVSSSSSSQISIVNTQISTKGIYQYRLHPIQTGELIIGPISVVLEGQTFTTDPITIQVSQGSAPSQPALAPDQAAPAPETLTGQDFFVEAEVDKPSPYLGEQVVYTFRFYQAVNLFDQPRYDAPSFTGFWNKQQSDQTQYTIQAANRVYRITELRTLLFPTIVGETTIAPATLTIPGGFLSQDQLLQTQPVALNVQALPPDAPPDFNGAVGEFNLMAEVDTTQGKVNEPLTLLVTLSGAANIENLPDPAWPDLPNWRTFESKATTNTQFQNGQLSGSRVYERLMVPGIPGEFTIPAITYTYFDPVAGEYRTITTDPILVSIAAAEEEPPVPVVVGSSKETVERLASDIRHIKPVPPTLESAARPLTSRAVYWLAWGLPLLLIAANFAWQQRRAYLQRHTGLARSLQARKTAKKQLTKARQTGQDPYSAAGHILTTYLSDKLNRPVVGLTQSDLIRRLQAKGVRPTLIKRTKICLTESDMGRFSPTASSPAHAEKLLNEVEQLIDELEKDF